MAPRAFISFQMEDERSKDRLCSEMNDVSDIAFVDFPIEDEWDSSWKIRCATMMRNTNGTVVLVGPTTHQSEAVLWEIAETRRQGHALLAIQTGQSERPHQVPGGVDSSEVIDWNPNLIAERLKTWS